MFELPLEILNILFENKLNVRDISNIFKFCSKSRTKCSKTRNNLEKFDITEKNLGFICL